AGRAGDEEQAVGAREEPGDPGGRGGREAEIAHVTKPARTVEEAEHDALAGGRGDDRDPDVDVASPHPQRDATVLGQAALRDVEPRHDLDPRREGGVQAERRREQVVQDAVDAQAYGQAALERLDVDVARTRAP